MPPVKNIRKPSVVYDQPDYSNKIYNITIKALQTGKKKKNALSLGKCSIKTLSVKTAVDYAGDQCGEKFNAPAEFLFSIICSGVQEFYDELDDSVIEGTNEIWELRAHFN